LLRRQKRWAGKVIEMIEQIRREIERLEESATRLQTLAQDNPAILKNAEIILSFVYILKFISPEKCKEEN
jgi:hypothetical protein